MTDESRTAYWRTWHAKYDEPGSPLARRLEAVQAMLRTALDEAPHGPITLISMCAGQAHDVLGVVPDHPRRHEVVGRLVELDAHNAQAARDGVAAYGLTGLEVVEADAGTSDAYLGAAPADAVLACGIFGNISDDDIHRTVSWLPALCRPGTTVIWTRHRREPDLTPTLRGWFAAAGFDELAFVSPPDAAFSVGSHRYAGRPPRALVAGEKLFTFTRGVGAG